jgi:hypothetical protein
MARAKVEETLVQEWHRGTRRIAGTDWPVVDQVKRLGRGRYVAIRGLCNGVPEAAVKFGRAKLAVELLEGAAKAAAAARAEVSMQEDEAELAEPCRACLYEAEKGRAAPNLMHHTCEGA